MRYHPYNARCNWLLIGRDGSVSEIKVLRGLPLGLTESAVETARQWRYEPTIVDGEAIEVRYFVTVRFEIDRPR